MLIQILIIRSLIDNIPTLFLGLIPLIVGRVKPKVLFVISQTITTLALITICIYSFINELSHVQDVDDENVLNSAPTVSLDISYVNGSIIVEDSNINDQSLIKVVVLLMGNG